MQESFFLGIITNYIDMSNEKKIIMKYTQTANQQEMYVKYFNLYCEEIVFTNLDEFTMGAKEI